jgi:hypothetical protein
VQLTSVFTTSNHAKDDGNEAADVHRGAHATPPATTTAAAWRLPPCGPARLRLPRRTSPNMMVSVARVQLTSVFTTSSRAKEMAARPPMYSPAPALLPRPPRQRRCGGCNHYALRALGSRGGHHPR